MKMRFSGLYLLLLFFKVIKSETKSNSIVQPYTFRCPSAAEWNLKASITCDNRNQYYCLLCPTTDIYECLRIKGGGYVEGCDGPVQDRKGFKKIIAGSFTREPCDENRYQPIIFDTNETTDCVYEKATCTEQGQVIFSNESGRRDRLCSCDYKSGYAHVYNLQDGSCSPSGYVDCSCYVKSDNKMQPLSPDYQYTVNYRTDVTSKVENFKSNNTFEDDEFSTRLTHINGDVTKLFITEWQDEDKKFVVTHASEHVLECIKKNGCVTVTGSSGVGKTATIRHVALQMKEKGFNIVNIKYPCDIGKQLDQTTTSQTLCVVDDCCGKYHVSQIDLDSWKKEMDDIKRFLEKPNNKIIIGCTLQVYQDTKFKALSLFKSEECNLQSEKLRLSKTERQSIAKLYLKGNATEVPEDNLYEFFPLLCRLCEGRSATYIRNLFEDPFTVYETELDKMNSEGAHSKRCVLALVVIYNNQLQEKLFTEHIDNTTQCLIENTCEAFKLSRGTSRLLLYDNLELLTGIFLKKNDKVYSTIHDKLFDFLSYYFGKHITPFLIKNVDSSFITERFACFQKEDSDNLTIGIPETYQDMYMNRLIKDWSDGEVVNVFSNRNMKQIEFAKIFFLHIKKQDLLYQERLAKKTDKRTKATVLICNCYLGYTDFVDWCLRIPVDINLTRHDGFSALCMACLEGHKVIVDMLLKHNADIDMCENKGASPLYIACQNDHTKIVHILLNHNAEVNKQDNKGASPLYIACQNGNNEIVKMLLNHSADIDKCDHNGISPLYMACQEGHVEIVETLLSHHADVNKCTHDDVTPLYIACQESHTTIVYMLLHSKADVNKFDTGGITPLYMACQDGHTEIVNMLLDFHADINKFDDCGISPLYIACHKGHTEIVNTLLNHNAAVNQCDNNDVSPLYMACQNGYSKIVNMLLNHKADVKKCDDINVSPLFMACQNGHAKIVKMLLDHNADVNTCRTDGVSPLQMARQYGHDEIVNMLCNHKADVAKCYNDGISN